MPRPVPALLDRMHRLAALACLLALLGTARGQGDAPAGDGRAAAVADLQGTALVRPAGRDRWSPLAPRAVLLPGDVVRTPARGANAVELRLAKGGALVLGPGALVQVAGGAEVRMLSGEAEVRGGAGAGLAVTGPGGFAATVGDARVLRATADATQPLAEAPRWLTGYRGSTTSEWMGSLLANVDGRNVPLTVGYHKVDVVIRDQVAETTVEESFVNATDGVLEGVFSFPLPADASISGFGMWVGDELVEADIVEKQRARAIYEDILRRKKDPGLLEWSGGNLFKASVYPIPARGEKRIRLRYTQVLPMEGSAYRYRYALRSELLRAHPLRKLQIRVRVHSSLSLTGVASPTHVCEGTGTQWDASLDHVAEEVSPDSDFEAVIGVDPAHALTVVPHRRGEDGYFLLLFQPPDPAAGAWKRELTPEGTPLDLVLVADTSGSMDDAARATQAAFLEGLLALLGPKDRFRLLVSDQEARWWRDAASPATPENAESALAFLAARGSLGWSDLDLALRQALAAASEGSLVLYVGDGIPTTGDADPVDQARRLRRMGEGARGTVHAVSVGSAYEQGVLEAMASIGGGSVRAAGDDPAQVAYGLLAEVAQPVVKDLRIAFEGVRTARVYPDPLPNLPAGRQQVILGRYLPTGATQRGRVVVTGTLGGKPLRFEAPFAVRDGEETNDFLPRLWARRHLDALLKEGAGAQDDIVAFSEEFSILTPFTSLLVLESDADRELYGVTRRVKMRDGERLFAQAKDETNTAVLQEQMRKARSWRLGLRRRMLAEIAALGRNLPHGGVAYGEWGLMDAPFTTSLGIGGGAGGSFRGPNGGAWERLSQVGIDEDSEVPLFGAQAEEAPPGDDVEGLTDFKPPGLREPGEPPMEEAEAFDDAYDRGDGAYLRESAAKRPMGGPMTPAFESNGRRNLMFSSLREDKSLWSYAYRSWSWIASNLTGRFPPLGPPAPEPPPPPETKWPAEVVDALRRCERAERLAAIEGALHARTVSASLHPLRGTRTGENTAEGWLSRGAWLVRRTGGEPLEQWLSDGVRGTCSLTQRLGRARPAVDRDGQWWQVFGDPVAQDFLRGYAAWDARIEARDGDRVTLRFSPPRQEKTWLLATFDVAKGVLVETRWFRNDTPTNTTRYADFVEVLGVWWPRRVSAFDAEDRETWRAEHSFEAIAADACVARVAAARAAYDDVILLEAEDPGVLEAKQAVFDGKGRFIDHLRIAEDHAAMQRWDEAWASFGRAAALAGDKPGVAWLRASLHSVGRQGDAMKAFLDGFVAGLKGRTGPEAAFAGELIHGYVLQVFGPNEVLGLLPALEALGGDAVAWQRRRAQMLSNAGREAGARAVLAAVLEAMPEDPQARGDYVDALARTGDWGAVMAQAAKAGELRARWLPAEADGFHMRVCDLLWNAMRLEDLLAEARRWVEASPASDQAYERMLAALLQLDRIGEFDAFLEAAFGGGAGAAKDPAARARLGAAIDAALGSFWNSSVSQPDPKWLMTVARVAREAARTEEAGWNLAGRALNRWQFNQTEAARVLRGWLREDFAAEEAIESMEPDRLARYVSWIPWTREEIDETLFRALAARVRARGGPVDPLLVMLDQHGDAAQAVEVLRERVRDASAEERPQLAHQLWARLLALPWTEAIEDEVLALLPKLVREGAEEAERRSVLAGAVREAADALLAGRIEARLGPVAARETLPRAELRKRTVAARAEARAGLAERLRGAAPTAPEEARRWRAVERRCLAAERGAEGVEGEVRELLAGLPADPGDGLAWVARERCVLVLSYLAVRRGAPPEAAERTLALLRERIGAESKLLDWRYDLFRLLVALDRTDALEAVLQEWIVPGKVESRWRVALGYLLAERGRLEEAAILFEQVAALGELDERGYVALADWCLVLGDDARRERARAARYDVVDVDTLSQRLWQERSRLSRNGDEVPGDLDPEVLRMIPAMLRKAPLPDQYLWVMHNLYTTVKDVRLLDGLPFGVLGHTPEGSYAFLEQVGQVLQDVHEEATCDGIAASVAGARAEAKAATDVRGLRLLTALVERRADEVLNQPGPHGAKALAALQEAWKGEWLPGERGLLASLLASLGRVPDEAFAKEQLRQLAELHRLEGREGTDRLGIAHALARTLWAYGQQDAALDTLAAALEEHREVRGGWLPPEALPVADDLVTWLRNRERFGAAEAFLLAERDRQPSRASAEWFTIRLFGTWSHCLQAGGTVSLGSGEALYRAARPTMERFLAEGAPHWIDEAMNHTLALYRAAHGKAKVASAAADLVAFSKGLFPEVLPRMGWNRNTWIQQVAGVLADVAGAQAGLTFLVERLEAEPDWYRRAGMDAWGQVGGLVERWRKSAGELEPRLLALVKQELARDLETMQSRGRYCCTRRRGGFWSEKAEEFAAVARAAVEARAGSPAHVLYAADYLWNDLDLRDEPIDVLKAADGRGALRADGRFRLVGWLHDRKRWAESLPHLEKLVAEGPDEIAYRVALVRALHHTGRDGDGKARVDATRARWEERKRWNENAIAQLGAVALECAYFERSAALFEDAVARRSRRRGGRGDGTLSGYYASLARAYVGLHRDDEAVDAASAAVVAWGSDQGNRQNALQALRDVVAGIGDLDAWAARWDAEAAKTGLDTPVIRLAVALVHIDRDPAKAVPHLLAARRLQPDDPEVHEALVKAYDKLRDGAKAAEALAARLRRTQREFPLYVVLAKRLDALGETAEAERARTGLAEAAPHEAEGHRMLAGIREAQGRLDEAIVQWEQVVRTRRLEPDGWLALAKAQRKAGRMDDARATVDHLLKTEWDPRFGDVRAQAAALLE